MRQGWNAIFFMMDTSQTTRRERPATDSDNTANLRYLHPLVGNFAMHQRLKDLWHSYWKLPSPWCKGEPFLLVTPYQLTITRCRHPVSEPVKLAYLGSHYPNSTAPQLGQKPCKYHFFASLDSSLPNRQLLLLETVPKMVCPKTQRAFLYLCSALYW